MQLATPENLYVLGRVLHTALRRNSDSTATSAAYNAICVDDYLVENKIMPWHSYLEALYPKVCAAIKEVNQGKHNTSHIVEVVKEHSTTNYEWAVKHNLSMTLLCIFQLFDDEDWEGYVSYLTTE